MTPQERNEVLEEAAMHMELCAGHYCAKKVRELKRDEKPVKSGIKVFALNPTLSHEDGEDLIALPEQEDFIVSVLQDWMHDANPGESAQIECRMITRKEFDALREI